MESQTERIHLNPNMIGASFKKAERKDCHLYIESNHFPLKFSFNISPQIFLPRLNLYLTDLALSHRVKSKSVTRKTSLKRRSPRLPSPSCRGAVTPAGQGERCVPAPPAVAASGSAATGRRFHSCARVGRGTRAGTAPLGGCAQGLPGRRTRRPPLPGAAVKPARRGRLKFLPLGEKAGRRRRGGGNGS